LRFVIINAVVAAMNMKSLFDKAAYWGVSTFVCILCCMPSGFMIERVGSCGQALCNCASKSFEGKSSAASPETSNTELRITLKTEISNSSTTLNCRTIFVMDRSFAPGVKLVFQDIEDSSIHAYGRTTAVQSHVDDVSVPPPRYA